MRQMAALLLVLLTGFSAFADYKVVTDIDGTLRRTHVRARGLEIFRLVGQVFVGNNYFSGLPEILQELSGDNSSECFHVDTETAESQQTISYVTAAPALLRPLGRRFLRKSCFPVGSYHSRQFFEDSKTFKHEAIRGILDESPQGNVLLLGDNGQHDPEVYDLITQEMGGQRNILTFIHMVYSAPVASDLYPGQLAFLTGADLAAQLYAEGWLSRLAFEYVVDVVHKDLTSGSRAHYERVFPRWLKCADFANSFVWPDVEMSMGTAMQLGEIDHAISERCLPEKNSIQHPVASIAHSSQSPRRALQCAELLFNL